MRGYLFYMVIDIDNKEVNIGDDIIFCDNRGVNKGKVLKINLKTIKIQYYKIQQVDGEVGDLTNEFQHIRLSGDNGRYIYKI